MKLLYEYGWILIAILALLYIYLRQGWDGIRVKAYQAMLWMEKNHPDDAGRTKFLKVLENVYPLLPKSLRYFLSKEQFAETLQKWYDEAKDFLDDGKLNQST